MRFRKNIRKCTRKGKNEYQHKHQHPNALSTIDYENCTHFATEYNEIKVIKKHIYTCTNTGICVWTLVARLKVSNASCMYRYACVVQQQQQQQHHCMSKRFIFRVSYNNCVRNLCFLWWSAAAVATTSLLTELGLCAKMRRMIEDRVDKNNWIKIENAERAPQRW